MIKSADMTVALNCQEAEVIGKRLKVAFDWISGQDEDGSFMSEIQEWQVDDLSVSEWSTVEETVEYAAPKLARLMREYDNCDVEFWYPPGRDAVSTVELTENDDQIFRRMLVEKFGLESQFFDVRKWIVCLSELTEKEQDNREEKKAEAEDKVFPRILEAYLTHVHTCKKCWIYFDDIVTAFAEFFEDSDEEDEEEKEWDDEEYDVEEGVKFCICCGRDAGMERGSKICSPCFEQGVRDYDEEYEGEDEEDE